MNYRLILASASPRRRQLMKDAGFTFEVRTKDIQETYPSGLQAAEIPCYLARLKAAAFREELKEDELLITADTIVSLGEKVIGKPKHREEAVDILKFLSGRKHTVVTGLCLSTCREERSCSVFTDVYFRPLSEKEIVYYIDTCSPYDKAGAYGIQEWIGYVGIERIDGSFYNVMGLPVQTLYQELRHFGVTMEG